MREKFPVSVEKKVCSKCGVEKSSKDFYKDPYHKDGLYSQCKTCRADALRLKRKTHPEECRRINRESGKRWRTKYPERYKRYKDSYKSRNEEKISEQQRSRLQKLRLEVLGHYCDGKISCSCCGESNPRFLTLDHKNNDGNVKRKEANLGSGWQTYAWIKRNDYPDDLQVLCMNCNFGKAQNGGVCPHKDGEN